MKAYLMIPLAILLAGCAKGELSVSGGECKLPSVHTPPIAVAGRTQYDQNWIDDTTEGLVRGCGQPRPSARLPEMDKLPPPKAVAPAPPKKKFWQRKAQPAPLPPVRPEPVPPLAQAAPITPPVTPPPEQRHWWQNPLRLPWPTK